MLRVLEAVAVLTRNFLHNRVDLAEPFQRAVAVPISQQEQKWVGCHMSKEADPVVRDGVEAIGGE